MTVRRRNFLAGAGALAAAPLLGATTPAHADVRPPQRPVSTGAQVLADSGWAALAGQKVGVVTQPDRHPGRPDPHRRHHARLRRGRRGRGVRARARLPRHRPGRRLRGQPHRPADRDHGVRRVRRERGRSWRGSTAKSGVETVVFDIQDVGARFYTYIWTMYRAMHAAADDRCPVRRTGPAEPDRRLRPRADDASPASPPASARRRSCQQHGMTVGELAPMFNAEYLPADTGGPRLTDLEIIRVEGLAARRSRTTTPAVPWVLPSPNMPTPDTAVLYPGMCLFEATNMSEGRGTTRPFELIGAPYIDYHWAEALADQGHPGARVPGGLLHADVQQERERALRRRPGADHRPAPGGGDLVASTHMLVEARRLYSSNPDPAKRFDWRGDGGRWIDLLTGSDRFRPCWRPVRRAEEIVAAWPARPRLDRAPRAVPALQGSAADETGPSRSRQPLR